MELMLVAAGAILLPLDALRMEALVLHGEVVAILTLAAGENDLFARHENFLRVKSVRGGLKPVGDPATWVGRSEFRRPRSALVNEQPGLEFWVESSG
jgi:hypothetical protein